MNEHTSTDSEKMKKNLNHTQNLMRGWVCVCVRERVRAVRVYLFRLCRLSVFYSYFIYDLGIYVMRCAQRHGVGVFSSLTVVLSTKLD